MPSLQGRIFRILWFSAATKLHSTGFSINFWSEALIALCSTNQLRQDKLIIFFLISAQSNFQNNQFLSGRICNRVWSEVYRGQVSDQCTMSPLLTVCFKSKALSHIPNCQFCHAISKNICLYTPPRLTVRHGDKKIKFLGASNANFAIFLEYPQ